ncbi:hypothetical protein Fcan01_09175 [Folsomia candida]|uniref:BEN domain-containing protein n=1 Tax=Folsomia candida TaxID=158441 RepID=A0A226EFV0_FOLCA|nr:hypothetical protein Fcan01_09175 [Folsomia candida]
MTFLLVEWVSQKVPKEYSVVPAESIEDGAIRQNAKSLINQIVRIIWKKGKIFPAVILETGDDEKHLWERADFYGETTKVGDISTNKRSHEILEMPVKKKGKQARLVAGRERADAIQDVLDSLESDQIIDLNPDTNSYKHLVSLTRKKVGTWAKERQTSRSLKEKHKRLKQKYRELKRKFDQSDNNIELFDGSGVRIESSVLASMRVMSPKPTILARNLFRQLFSAEELSNHSLFGKQSNANRGRETLPEIDSVRRDAVINFILKDEGFGEAPDTGNPTADKVFIKARGP